MRCAPPSKTGRVVIVDEACLTGSAAAEIAAILTEDPATFRALKAPPKRVCAPDVPIPIARSWSVSAYRTSPHHRGNQGGTCMKYGFTLPGRGPLATPDNLAAIARRGEELGYHFVLFGDHIVVPRHIASPYPYTETGEFPGSASGVAMEQLTVLAFLAGQTQTIRLATSVIIVPHRNPLWPKALATLDVLSKGRLRGVGCRLREEFEALGLPPSRNGARSPTNTSEPSKSSGPATIPASRVSTAGSRTLSPKPVQKPHPPIWVGGESRRALRRTAELGNGWYPI